jgi:cytochrome c peroxidase
MKRFEKQKIEKYLNNINSNTYLFPEGYLATKTVEIETLNWILAYYNDKTVSTPKEYFEALLRDINTMTPEKMRVINLLYYWTYYKKIVGF